MLMIDQCSPGGEFGVVLFSLDTGQKNCLTKPDSLKGTDSGSDFVLSPDGGLIAFTRVGASGCCNIYTIPVSGGAPHLLTAGTRTQCTGINDLGCGGLMWTQDGKSIVFVSSRSNLPSLWHVSAIDGSVERETSYPAIGNFSRDGRRLVYSEKSSGEPPAIWRTDLASIGGAVVGTRKLISSQYPEMDAQPSPDGSHIVWVSTELVRKNYGRAVRMEKIHVSSVISSVTQVRLGGLLMANGWRLTVMVPPCLRSSLSIVKAETSIPSEMDPLSAWCRVGRGMPSVYISLLLAREICRYGSISWTPEARCR